MEISGCHRRAGASLRERNSLNCATVAVSNRFIEFAPGRALVYLLESSFHAQAPTATFDGQAVRMIVPMHVMTEWIESDQVSIEAPSRAGVQLLIEKDFQCHHKAREQDPDAYPHPLMS